MARKRLYDSDAEKQAAYRERKQETWRAKVGPSNAELAKAARDLHDLMTYAAEVEENSTAALLLGANARETLKNVQGFLCPLKMKTL
jgi:flagellar biosynthesis chaperone FliJ